MVRKEETLNLKLRSQALTRGADGRNCWRAVVAEKSIPARQVAIIICDMWDDHWSRGAAERVDAMAPRLNQVVRAARERGVQIIHAPSDTLNFYAGTAARERMLAVPKVEPPPPLPHDDPHLPVDDSDGGSDTGPEKSHRAWSRQHPAIEIQDEDGVSDEGLEIYSFLQYMALNTVLIMGVHTNMCLLNRSFGIKALVKWGVDVALVRDLTDALYNPARRPYVSHDEGTRLVVEHIEKFWCPTVASEELAGK